MGFYKNIRGSFANYKKVIREFAKTQEEAMGEFSSLEDDINIYNRKYNEHKTTYMYGMRGGVRVADDKLYVTMFMYKGSICTGYKTIKIDLLQNFLIDVVDYISTECSTSIHGVMICAKTIPRSNIHIYFINEFDQYVAYIDIPLSTDLDDMFNIIKLRALYGNIRVTYDNSFFPGRETIFDEFDPKLLRVEKVK